MQGYCLVAYENLEISIQVLYQGFGGNIFLPTGPSETALYNN